MLNNQCPFNFSSYPKFTMFTLASSVHRLEVYHRVALYKCHLHSLCKISVFLGEHISLPLCHISHRSMTLLCASIWKKKVQNYVFVLLVFNKWTVRTDPINCMKYITGFYWLKCLWRSGELL